MTKESLTTRRGQLCLIVADKNATLKHLRQSSRVYGSQGGESSSRKLVTTYISLSFNMSKTFRK